VIIILKQGATEEEKQHIIDRVKDLGYGVNVSGVAQTVIGAIGVLQKDRDGLMEQLGALPYVERVVPVLKRYKLASIEFHPERTTVPVGDCLIGGERLAIMAGPCSVESEEQLLDTARVVREAGATILRGGAFKPRTSPYEFQGFGEDGLKILAAAREACGLAIVTEVLDPHDVDLVCRYADMLQIGARNMQNYTLLREVGRARKPVLLKRGGMYPTIENWLLSAEYVLAEGNRDVVLCERGLPPYGDTNLRRNVLDLTAVPLVKDLSHLPVIVDPSHGTGKANLVPALSRAAVIVGADGLMVEVHPAPELAWSDGPQSLDFPAFRAMMRDLLPVVQASGRRL
jgi:3-deoxy-7-phosphoheptulonate synthase